MRDVATEFTDAAGVQKEGVAIDADQMTGEYATFIIEIFKRLDAIAESMAEIKANPESLDNWKNCDFCWFQIRKICEYLSLAIVLAHHRDGGAVNDLGKWKPSDLLKRIEKLNAHPTPVQISNQIVANDEGGRQLTPFAKPIESKVISQIYGKANDVLHVGSLARILSMKMPAYDLGQLERWWDGFERLLRNHVLMLPQVQRILVCLHDRASNAPPKIFLMEGEGEAIFVTENLPEFEMIVE